MLTLAIAATAAAPQGATACAVHLVRPSTPERLEDAAMITLSLRHAVRASSVDASMATGDFRLVRASLVYSGPSVFIFHGHRRGKLVGIWSVGWGSPRQAYAWARTRIGASAEAARCLAAMTTTAR